MSGSNSSTHSHVETHSMQNAVILDFLTFLITFRYFYNKEREDALKSFTLSFTKWAMPSPAYIAHLMLHGLWMKKAALEFFFPIS